MPQINEISWILISLKFYFIFLFMLILIHYINFENLIFINSYFKMKKFFITFVC